MIPLKETILQSIPQEYWVNDSRGIQNPLDLEAERLGVSLRLLSMNAEDYQNLAKIFDRSEAEIRSVIPKALSASYAVLDESEKRSGVLLAALGSYGTDLVYFKENILHYSRSLDWGSERLSRALSEKFRLKPAEARRLKDDFGTLLEGSTDEESLPLSRETFGPLVLKRRELREFLALNLEEFLISLDSEIRHIQAQEGPLVQLVLTGGGAKLEGLLETIENRTSVPTRLGSPKTFTLESDSRIPSDTSWAALWGALKHESGKIQQDKRSRQSKNFITRAAVHAREWLESYF
jgi:cell division protein FtsA